MSALFSIADKFDRLGLRRLVAPLATIAYRRNSSGKQAFEVDRLGRWVNRQPEATIVSPTMHTTSHDAFRDWVMDNWCWDYMPKEGDTVIDVGAGVGEEAIIFSRLVGPGGRVISIEAQPSTFACLEETVRRSGLSNVTPLCIALAEEDGVALIADGSSHLTSSIVTGGEGVEVPAKSLGTVLDELGIAEVALLKMNIEGAERLAVRGMAGVAAQVLNVCISCHDFLADRGGDEALRTKREVAPQLEAMGYRLTTRPTHGDPWVRDYYYGVRA